MLPTPERLASEPNAPNVLLVTTPELLAEALKPKNGMGVIESFLAVPSPNPAMPQVVVNLYVTGVPGLVALAFDPRAARQIAAALIDAADTVESRSNG